MEEIIQLTAPTKWKDLNEKQLIYASWLLSTGDLTAEEIWTYAFIRFTGVKVRYHGLQGVRLSYKKKRFTLDPQECLSFARQFQYLTAGIDEIIPLRKLAGSIGSDPRLRGAPLSQYLACENYYQAFLFKKNPDFLNKLCACFYTKDDFNDGRTEKHARKFAKLPFHVRYTVFLWFSGLKKVLKNHFPNYFIEMEVEESDSPSPPNMRKQIEQMLRALSGGDVTKVSEIYSVDTWTALAELDAKAHEYKVMKQKMKK